MSISPNDILPNGTRVRVGNKRGCVVGCEVVRAVPSGFISVHEIHFSERAEKKLNKTVWSPYLGLIQKVNYSFIELC